MKSLKTQHYLGIKVSYVRSKQGINIYNGYFEHLRHETCPNMCVCVRVCVCSCHVSKLLSKLDCPLFKGIFLSILHQNEARLGGWDFLSSQVYFLPKYSIQYCNYGLSAMVYIIVSWLNFQLGKCMLIKVVRYSATFLCFQIKV